MRTFLITLTALGAAQLRCQPYPQNVASFM
jgi:hypothetical protein